jgi:transcriptional regulator with XRE-family HTH domain
VTDSELIGDRIKQERIAAQLTQRELAELAEVGVPHISKVEANRENPSDELLHRLAKIFKVNADELIILARRVPDEVMDKLAQDPAGALAYLRSWKPHNEKRNK